MKFVCYADWQQLPASADALFAEAEQESIFLSRSWFENLTANGLDDGESLLLACVVAGDRVLAILPLKEFSGKTLYSLKHRYTPFYSLLLTEPDQQKIIECLVQGLSQMSIDCLLLEPVDGDDSKIDRLQHELDRAGFVCERNFRLYNWIYRVQGQSFEEYLAARPGRLRNTITRKKRKLEREHGYRIRLFIGEEVPRAMSDYYATYTASWKANEQYQDLVDGMVTGFSEPGWSRLAVLYVNEQPVAAQLWFVLHGRASIFRLSYDEAWKPYSPGSILMAYLMEYVIDVDGVEEIDFLTGNDAYKQDWMSVRRQRFALSCIKNREPAGRLTQFVQRLKLKLKR